MASTKFIEGKEGYLFLDNDTNGIIAQTTGRFQLSQDLCSRIYFCHLERRLLCNYFGSIYNHIIVPNKESVLIELLPEEAQYESVGPTPLRRYFEAIPAARDLTYFNPNILRNLSGGREGYYIRDTHWNSKGALTYFRDALENIRSQESLSQYSALDLSEKSVEHHGDLALHAGLQAEREMRVVIRNASAQIIHHGNVANEGYVRHTVCYSNIAQDKKVLVLHDSFTIWLYDVFSELFKECLFVHCPHFDPVFVERYKPDETWHIQCERFFPRVPGNEIDLTAWVFERELAKGADHRTSNYLKELILN